MQSECTRTVGQGEVYITSSTCFRREFFEKKRNLCKALKNVASIRDPLENKIAREMEIEQSPLSLSEGICCQYSSFVQHAKKSKETSNSCAKHHVIPSGDVCLGIQLGLARGIFVFKK